MLQELVGSTATAATTDTVVLNLATLLELRSDRPLQAKRDSLVRAAKAGPGSEGMAGGCFKLE